MRCLNQLFTRSRRYSELSETNHEHLEEKIADLMEDGMSREEAEGTARREFGNLTLIEERGREVWQWPTLESLWADTKYAARQLRNSPGFAFIVILTLACSIGITTSVFSLVDRILFAGLPYKDGSQLVSVGISGPMLPYEFLFGANYLDLRDRQTLFKEVTSWSGVHSCDVTTEEPIQLHCAAVEASFLSTLGVKPLLGAEFTRVNDNPQTPPSVILTYHIWQARFAGSRKIIGGTLLLDGRNARIIGVLPRDFVLPTLAQTDLLVPQVLNAAMLERAKTGRPLRVIARLWPHQNINQARAAFEVVMERSLRGAPSEIVRQLKPSVRPLRDLQMGNPRFIAKVLFGSVLCALLLVCANLVNLLLSLATTRRRETAVRSVLGASRARLIRQALTESLLFCALGGGVGIIIAFATNRLLIHFAPGGIPYLTDATMGVRTLLFALACSMLCVLASSLVPALTPPTPEAFGSKEAPISPRGWLKSSLVVIQLAISLALVTGAALLAQTLWNYEHALLGMETKHIVTASFTLSGQRYPDSQYALTFFESLEKNLQAVPGFNSVAISDSLPPQSPLRSKPLAAIDIHGMPQQMPVPGSSVWRVVTPDYFRTLDIPIMRGRAFTEQDRDPQRHVTIISQAFAQQLFPQVDPIGKYIGRNPEYLIIGIAHNVENEDLKEVDEPEYYVPRSQDASSDIYQYPNELREGAVIVNTSLPLNISAQLVREEFAHLDPSLAVQLETMSESISRMSARPRFSAILFSIFAGISLVIASAGVYGVLALYIAQSRREIGLRMALGATRASVLMGVLLRGARWLLSGIVCGLVLSFFLSNTLRILLYGIPKRDFSVCLISAALLSFTATVAACLPAIRAASIDPMHALRSE